MISDVRSADETTESEAFTPRSFRSLPGPKGLPLLGNALQLDPQRLHLVVEEWARAYGPVYRAALGPRPVLVLGEASLIQRVLSARPEGFRRVRAVESVLQELSVHGVFSAEGAAWKRQRKLIMPAFSMRQQRDLFPLVQATTERLRARWVAAAKHGEPLDVHADLRRYTVDVTSQVVLGDDLGTLSGKHSAFAEHAARMFRAASVRSAALVPYWRYVKLPEDRAVDASVAYVKALIHGAIVKARGELASDRARAENPRTLLEAMILAQDEDDEAQRFSDEEVVGNVMTLLLAGEDTTSNTLAWLLHYLAHEPEVQARLREEADAVLGEAPVAPRYEDVAKLKYAAAVTHEALRLRAPAPLLFLETLHEVEVAGVTLPAGHWVFCLLRHAGLSEQSFGEAARFLPARWLAEAPSGCPHDARAAFAFGAGPRTCPGRSLALFECAMVASMVAKCFVVEPVDARDAVQESYDFTMSPKGLRLQLRARSDARSDH